MVLEQMTDEQREAYLATSDGPERGPHLPPGFKFKPLPPKIFDLDETERRILGLP